MLRAESSNCPYALYLKAGIDMTTSAPNEVLAARMNRLMDPIEAVAR
jgi:oligoendopeptidase F